MAETPPTNTVPELVPGVSSATETRVLDWERVPVNLSGAAREAERDAAFLDFIFPCSRCMHVNVSVHSFSG